LIYRKDAREHFDLSEEEVFDKSLGLYGIALKMDPKNFDLAEDIAQTYYFIRTQVIPRKMARPEEALKAWEYALDIAPGENEKQGVQIHLARINLAIDRLAEARNALAQVNLPVYKALKEKIGSNVDRRMKALIPPADLR